MTSRYKTFAEKGARDIKKYNEEIKKEGGPNLPYILVIIDELADLMIVAQNDVEDTICRIAQLGRACGIHLVIATQRPSVDVITGVIKANIPSRIAFAVSSQVDSRTIIDMAGAEKLLGKGDMLYYPIGFPKPVRLQGAFINDREVEVITDFLKEETMAQYDEGVMEGVNGSAAAHGRRKRRMRRTFPKSRRNRRRVRAGLYIHAAKAASGRVCARREADRRNGNTRHCQCIRGEQAPPDAHYPGRLRYIV